MAFERVNLINIASSTKSSVIPAIWEYYNKAGDDVTAVGYVPAFSGIKNNDRVLVVTTSAKVQPAWYYATVASNKVTLGACDTVPASITLDSLQDVELTSASSGNVLKYNGTKWVNEPPATPSLSGLSDVKITEVEDGDTLTYDGTDSKWENKSAE